MPVFEKILLFEFWLNCQGIPLLISHDFIKFMKLFALKNSAEIFWNLEKTTKNWLRLQYIALVLHLQSKCNHFAIAIKFAIQSNIKSIAIKLQASQMQSNIKSIKNAIQYAICNQICNQINGFSTPGDEGKDLPLDVDKCTFLILEHFKVFLK